MRTDVNSSTRLWWALGAVCATAAFLRVYALDYGLPGIYNPDELPILNRALAFAKGDLNPHNFLYPSLQFYALFVWEGLFFAVGRVVGLFHSLGDFQAQFFRDHPEGFDFRTPGKEYVKAYADFIVDKSRKLGSYGQLAAVRAAVS